MGKDTMVFSSNEYYSAIKWQTTYIQNNMKKKFKKNPKTILSERSIKKSKYFTIPFI